MLKHTLEAWPVSFGDGATTCEGCGDLWYVGYEEL